ncbi:MAG: glycosyltransferase [Bacillota bacterium]|nr:glycosyltransferase [Bacillota bacterium]
MKRILVVGDFIKGSGVTQFIVSTFINLDQTKYKIDVMAYDRDATVKAKIQSLGWQYHSVTPLHQNPVRFLLDWHSFLKRRAANYDIIHFNYSASWNYLPIVWAKKFTHAKIVVHSHNAYFGNHSNKLVMSFLLRLHNHGRYVISKYSDFQFATSMDAAKWMFTADLVNAKRVKILRNGINLDRFNYQPAIRDKIRTQFNLQHNFLIGFAGVLLSRKNPQFALEVFYKVFQKRPEAKLIILGDGPLKQELMDRAKALGLTDVVIFKGIVDNIEEWYQAFDALIFPSKVEGFGLVALEAQATGLPILISENFPSIVSVTKLVHTNTLSAGAPSWADILLNLPAYKRHDQSELLREANFSVTVTADKLNAYYTDLMRNSL